MSHYGEDKMWQIAFVRCNYIVSSQVLSDFVTIYCLFLFFPSICNNWPSVFDVARQSVNGISCRFNYFKLLLVWVEVFFIFF